MFHPHNFGINVQKNLYNKTGYLHPINGTANSSKLAAMMVINNTP